MIHKSRYFVSPAGVGGANRVWLMRSRKCRRACQVSLLITELSLARD